MIWRLAFTAALLARASATGSRMMVDGMNMLSTSEVLERRYADAASRQIERRQQMQFETDAALNPDGTVDMVKWEQQANSACMEALSQLQLATNPSGNGLCYNLPTLNTTTGVFQADLRVFKINEPSGIFTGIAAEKIEVNVLYNGASAKRANESTEDGATLTPPTRREVNPVLLKKYLFLGQIDQSKLNPGMDMADFEALVMPVLVLTAVNMTGQTITTNVSSNEAVFVTGIFSKEVVMSEFALAQWFVDDAVASVKNGTVAFVLPGVHIMIFPVGLLITTVWLIIGVGAYGYGTYERIQYAKSYRRRKAMAYSSVRG